MFEFHWIEFQVDFYKYRRLYGKGIVTVRIVLFKSQRWFGEIIALGDLCSFSIISYLTYNFSLFVFTHLLFDTFTLLH
jgi:hypothetical protein